MPEADADFMPNVFDGTYLNLEVAITRDGDGPDFAKLTKRLREKDGLPIGRAHNIPILYTRMYELEYKDRHIASMSTNTIANNMFDQVDGEVNRHVIFQEIVNHRYDGTEVKEQDAFITTRNGTKRCRERKKPVEVLDQWKDGITTWVTLKDMKNSYPV